MERLQEQVAALQAQVSALQTQLAEAQARSQSNGADACGPAAACSAPAAATVTPSPPGPCPKGQAHAAARISGHAGNGTAHAHTADALSRAAAAAAAAAAPAAPRSAADAAAVAPAPGTAAADPPGAAATPSPVGGPSGGGYAPAHGLSKAQVERYSRQLVLPAFGVAAQARLCAARVLVVGCGGLGAPAAMYLAAAGVGCLGLVDRDAVELSNLHRQIIHNEARVGQHKAGSAAAALAALNSGVALELHTEGLTPGNAVRLVGAYDCVLDCSDNPPTRYLVSDACVACGVPLVSAAAVGTEGQLTVYAAGGDCPCYRCLYPEAPAPENCARCADAGVLGPVPGVMGTLQALEALKVVARVGQPLTRRLLVFDGLAGRVTAVKLRARSPGCVACGDTPAVTRASIERYDYAAFTGQAAAGDGPPPPLRLLPPEQRWAPARLAAALRAARRGEGEGEERAEEGGLVVLDVRPEQQYAAVALPGSHSVPMAQLEGRLGEVLRLCGVEGGGAAPAAAAAAAAPRKEEEEGVGDGAAACAGRVSAGAPQRQVVVVCRRGNDSQRAVARLRRAGVVGAVDVVGGMQAWALEVDPSIPLI